MFDVPSGSAGKYTTPLSSIIEEFSLIPVFLPEKEAMVQRSDLIRPGLALAGYFDLFEPERIQLIGNTEYGYLNSLPEQTRRERLFSFFSKHPVAVIYTGGNQPYDGAVDAARTYEVPLLKTETATSDLFAALISSLSQSLAPRITRHGVLVEVYGEGILILGDSGIGKSETALELIKRGHRLIADDAVEIKRVSAKTLVGSAPASIRHYAELRGIGIVDIRRIFGMGAVKETEKINMVIYLQHWDQSTHYDRLGVDEETLDIMGIRVPKVTIPVRPGRNLAIIIEIAAMNNREKRMGYNTAEEFNRQILIQAGIDPDTMQPIPKP